MAVHSADRLVTITPRNGHEDGCALWRTPQPPPEGRPGVHIRSRLGRNDVEEAGSVDWSPGTPFTSEFLHSRAYNVRKAVPHNGNLI